MRNKKRLGQYFIVCLLILCCVTTGVDALSEAQEEIVANSVVFLNTLNGTGNGFFLTPYTIVTGMHLIEGLEKHQIKIKWYKTKKVIGLVAIDYTLSNYNLALLTVDVAGNPLPIADINDINQSGLGGQIYVASYEDLGDKRKEISFEPMFVSNNNSSNICKTEIKFNVVSYNDGGPIVSVNAAGLAIHFPWFTYEKNFSFSIAIPVKPLKRWIDSGRNFEVSIPLGDPCKKILKKILRGNAAARKVRWLEQVKSVDPSLRIAGDYTKDFYLLIADKNLNEAGRELGRKFPWKRLWRHAKVLLRFL